MDITRYLDKLSDPRRAMVDFVAREQGISAEDVIRRNLLDDEVLDGVTGGIAHSAVGWSARPR